MPLPVSGQGPGESLPRPDAGRPRALWQAGVLPAAALGGAEAAGRDRGTGGLPAAGREGVGAVRRECMHLVDMAIWVQADEREMERRNLARVGRPDEMLTEREHREWVAEEIPFPRAFLIKKRSVASPGEMNGHGGVHYWRLLIGRSRNIRGLLGAQRVR
jgi:hypothetical protein